MRGRAVRWLAILGLPACNKSDDIYLADVQTSTLARITATTVMPIPSTAFLGPTISGAGSTIIYNSLVELRHLRHRATVVEIDPSTSPNTVRLRTSAIGPWQTVVLADPQLLIWNSAGQSLDQNDDWQAHPRAAEIAASGFAPLNAKESALLLTLAPGSYTATVSGVGASANGVATIEVYELP